MKTPEEYFLERDYLDENREDMTSAEKAFLKRYMGLGEEAGEEPSEQAPAAPETAAGARTGTGGEEETAEAAPGAEPEKVEEAPEKVEEVSEKVEEVPEKGQAASEEAEGGKPDEPSLEDRLKEEAEVQLVAFTVQGQEYTVPISAVQEVIRFMEPTKLPAAPHFLAGIINLRGRVTPLVRLYDLLGVAGEDKQNRFIVVCRIGGLQFGLMIEKMKTMYHAPQEKIDWSVEAHLGVTADYIAGLLKGEDGLIGILSVDRIVAKVLTG